MLTLACEMQEVLRSCGTILIDFGLEFLVLEGCGTMFSAYQALSVVLLFVACRLGMLRIYRVWLCQILSDLQDASV